MTPEDSGTPDESDLLRAAKPAQDGLSATLMRANLRRQLLDVPAPLELGRRYLVIETIGSGGMGTVYSAYDSLLRRKVALKTLRPFGDEGPQAVLREARALAQLAHPNVVEVYEVGQDDVHPYIVMELVDGVDLRTWLQPRPSPSEILSCMIGAGRGLGAAHVAGVVHGDFKPDNVLVSHGRARVVDFGLAHADASPEGPLGGTRSYMAPECLEGDVPSAASDQYSFSVTLFEAICGQRPPVETTGTGLLEGMTSVPRPVAEAIARGLSPEPGDRWPSMNAMLEQLQWDPARRRNRWLRSLGGLVVLGLAGWTWHSWAAAQAAQCSGAEEGLAGIWDDARRAETQRALLADDVPYARQVWERTERELDRYAEAWSSMHVEACEATNVRGEQSSEVMDLRMRCLDRATVELQGVTGVLADADADVVTNAHKLTSGLPPLSRCADVDALRAELEPPLPGETKAVEQTRALLAEAKAARKAGRYAEAQAAVERAKSVSADVNYGPLHTEVALAEGRALDRGGQYAAAEASLRRALELGSRWRQRTLMANAATLLLYQVGYRLQHVDEGLAYSRVALGLTTQEPLLEAEARSSIGSVLQAQGRYDEAEVEVRRALVLQEEAANPDFDEIATLRSNLGNVHTSQGRHEDAEAEHRRALALWDKTLGPEHPSIASAHNNLGALFGTQAQWEEAEVEFRRALALWERALGPEHPSVSSARNNLAVVLNVQGKLEEAEAELRRVVAQRENQLGPDHPDVATVRRNLSGVLGAQGKLEEAEAQSRRAIAIWDRALGSDHPHIAASRCELAALLLERGRFAEALPIAEKAWRVRQGDAFPPDQQAQAALVVARALWETSPAPADRKRARMLAERALEGFTKAGEHRVREAAFTKAWLREHKVR